MLDLNSVLTRLFLEEKVQNQMELRRYFVMGGYFYVCIWNAPQGILCLNICLQLVVLRWKAVEPLDMETRWQTQD